MRIAYFDCFAGIRENTVLGALLDMGFPVQILIEELRKIPLTGYAVQALKEQRGRITGTRVLIQGDERPYHSRHEIQGLIQRSRLDGGVQRKILDVFEKLARAESHVHHLNVSEVPIHEAGALASILGVAGVAIGLDYLQIDRVCASAIPVGRGWVKTLQGMLPLPAPAAVQLLEGVPIYGSNTARELVTPTGAAILAALVGSYGPIPAMTLHCSGYGVGNDPGADPPDLLRVLVGVCSSSWLERCLVLLETNIDDMNPEVYGYVMDRLFRLGVLDVTMVPVQMKKNRPGVMLQVLVEPALQPQAVELLFRETTTLGVRIQEVKRVELSRKLEVLETPYGRCEVKRVFLPDGESRVIPEYETCRRFAEKLKKPLREVYEEVLSWAKQAE